MSQSDRWKYLVVTVKSTWTGTIADDRLQEDLNSHGTLGWELISAGPLHQALGGLKLIFKRAA